MKKVYFRTNRAFIYSIILTILFIIFLFVPYSHDEWAWGTETGIENLKNLFQGYNGRYFGDIISLLITRNVAVKALVMSGSLVWLVKAIIDLMNRMNHKSLWPSMSPFFVLGLAFLIPVTLFQQTYGWPAAFVNFVPPMIAVVYLLVYHLKDLDHELSTGKQIAVGVGIMLGAQFFSENVSIYTVILGVMLMIDARMTTKRISPFHWAILFISLLGTIVMYLNPAYLKAATHPGDYKTIDLSVTFLLEKVRSTMIPNIFTNYGVILSILAIVIAILTIRSHQNLGLVQQFALIFVFALPTYGLFFNSTQLGPIWLDSLIVTLLAVVYCIALFYLVWLGTSGIKRRMALLSLLSAVLISSPLLMANPVGPRAFYGTFIFWILLIVICLAEILSTTPEFINTINTLGMVTIISLLTFYFLVFAYQYHAQIVRQNIIETQLENGKKKIVLPELPNTQFVWRTSSNDPWYWNPMFKKFYHIPSNTKVIFPDAPDYHEFYK
ncbi:hypothetical protein EVE90_11005 [Lacticaseibacillus paracasei]|uniref:DUF6056 family protein n=1 Tax=Lacticaseibacillus paracasei TaxID=1597 RepID=UPI0010184E77|nr:DUF6056 family protein [Lacticaseibacillus paracasei]QBA74821.1 hypothetical protein EVE90_11005 [Lacticaseibacillus paracasei]